VQGQDARATWNLFRLNWLLIAAMSNVLALGVWLTDFDLAPHGYLIAFSIGATYGVLGYFNAISPRRRNPQVAFSLTAVAQFILVVSVMTPISYIATSANLPLKDAALLSVDRLLGFDFRSYLSFINDRPWLVWLLASGYRAIHWQILLVVVALPLVGYHRKVAKFLCAFLLALIVTICISAAVPAIGVYGVLDLTPLDFPNIVETGYPGGYADTLRVAPLLRDGSLRVLNFFELAGVLTFPSFHAISAILYIWAFWPILWMRPFTLLCNGTMIVSTPVGGGHFFVDVIAGIAVAAFCIYAARYLDLAVAGRTARRDPPPTLRKPADYHDQVTRDFA
jgi:uncharacterized membrane protein YiaA